MNGAELREIRERAGMLQPEFADRLGVHSVTLSRFERDRKPISITVELAVFELARRLGVDVESIIPKKVKRK